MSFNEGDHVAVHAVVICYDYDTNTYNLDAVNSRLGLKAHASEVTLVKARVDLNNIEPGQIVSRVGNPRCKAVRIKDDVARFVVISSSAPDEVGGIFLAGSQNDGKWIVEEHK